ncbi:MAG: cysteine desulfurase [Deltaproteobacteria bacterium]|nr:MAG: cysteine desulfurase [Deltaproteobacteria bacterium]
MHNELIYLDHHATTPCDPAVVEAMLPYFGEAFGNASSTTHALGRAAAAAVAEARDEVARTIGASAREIVFTSGTTEALNLALFGVMESYAERGRHLVTTTIEHPAVLDTCAALERRGIEVTRVGVGADGIVDPDDVARVLRDDTVCVAVMAANNEIGTLQPLAEIGARCRAAGARFLVDAAQAVGKVPFDVAETGADLVAFSAHKLYGPKGVGALYVRRRPRVLLEAQVHGGGHERGLRSGTLNVPGIVGFGAACRIARERLSADGERIGALRDRLLAGLEAALDDVRVNGSLVDRLPHNLNVSFGGVEGRRLLDALAGVALSTGSACASADLEASHVLRAIGVGDDRLYASLRFGLGRSNTAAEIDLVVERVAAAVRRLRP